MKVINLYAIALVAIYSASCKKDYTCNCTDAQGKITEVTVIHNTKSSAKTTCAARKNSPETCAIQ